MPNHQVSLERIGQLKTTLEKMMLYEGHPTLSRNDFEVMQYINNIEHYFLSSSNYDASSQISILKQLVKDCSPKVAEHLRPFLANL